MSKTWQTILAIVGIGGSLAFGGTQFDKGGLLYDGVSNQKVAEKYAQTDDRIRGKYQLDGNTLKIQAPDKNSVAISLGDKTKPEFEPKLEITRWEGKAKFSIKPKGLEVIQKKDKDLTFEGDKIKFETPDITYEYFDAPTSTEEGGYEYQLVLNKKPATSTFYSTIDSTGLEFYKQLPLTQEEIDRDSQRPENVINSYAVYYSGSPGDYSKMGGYNFRAGKFGHIYRIKAIDADGNWIWCDQNISGNVWAKTCDFNWLDKVAKYPVKIDPTIGYTSVGASSDNESSVNRLLCTGVSVYLKVIPDSISLYSKKNPNDANWKGVIVASSTKIIMTNGISDSGLINSTTDQWWTNNYTNKPTILNGLYLFCYISDAAIMRRYDSSGASFWRDTSNSYSSPSNPTDINYVDAKKLSIYITYTSYSCNQGTSDYCYNYSNVQSANDNSFCYNDGATCLNQTNTNNLRMGYRSGAGYGNCYTGFRFASSSIPKNAVIATSTFTYKAYDTDATTDNVWICADPTSTSPIFSTTKSDYNSAYTRATTTNCVSWTLPNQVDGKSYNSPDIRTVIQELVNRSDWTTSSPITILIRNNGATENHNAEAFSYSTLEVFYQEASASTPSGRPTSTYDANRPTSTFKAYKGASLVLAYNTSTGMWIDARGNATSNPFSLNPASWNNIGVEFTSTEYGRITSTNSQYATTTPSTTSGLLNPFLANINKFEVYATETPAMSKNYIPYFIGMSNNITSTNASATSAMDDRMFMENFCTKKLVEVDANLNGSGTSSGSILTTTTFPWTISNKSCFAKPTSTALGTRWQTNFYIFSPDVWTDCYNQSNSTDKLLCYKMHETSTGAEGGLSGQGCEYQTGIEDIWSQCTTTAGDILTGCYTDYCGDGGQAGKCGYYVDNAQHNCPQCYGCRSSDTGEDSCEAKSTWGGDVLNYGCGGGIGGECMSCNNGTCDSTLCVGYQCGCLPGQICDNSGVCQNEAPPTCNDACQGLGYSFGGCFPSSRCTELGWYVDGNSPDCYSPRICCCHN